MKVAVIPISDDFEKGQCKECPFSYNKLNTFAPDGEFDYDSYCVFLRGWKNCPLDIRDVEPLTDTEQRIFLAAMSREENACKEVCADGSDGGVDLVAVCHRIERKVKKVLWK